MNWIYYIPHEWNPPEARMTWADILLLPEAAASSEKALWLTVDAIPGVAAEQSRKDLKRRRTQLAWLGRADYRLDPEQMDLTVRVVDFNKPECLDWVERWLADTVPFSGLVAGTLEDFAGRSGMADLIISLRDR